MAMPLFYVTLCYKILLMYTLKAIVDLIQTDIAPLMTTDARVDLAAVEEKVVSILASVVKDHHDAKRSLDSFFSPYYLFLEPFKRNVPFGSRMIPQQNETLMMATIPNLHSGIDMKDSRVYTMGASSFIERVSFQSLVNGGGGLLVSGPSYAINGTTLIYSGNGMNKNPYLFCEFILLDPRQAVGFVYDQTLFPANNDAIEKLRYLVKRDMLARNMLVQDPIVNALDNSQNMSVGKQNQEAQDGDQA